MVHLSWLGRNGMTELGELLIRRTDYARRRLTAIDGVEALHDAPVVREFAVTVEGGVEDVIEHCAARGIAAGVPLGAEYGGNGLLVAITEQRTRADIDALAEAIEGALAGERAAGSGRQAAAGAPA
jgi:glycine dehydrogenase subunit 1